MAAKKYRRHALLLNEPKIRAWFDEVSLGSEATAKNYLRMLGIFCEREGVTPPRLLEISDESRVGLLRKYVQAHKDANGASPASRVVKKALVSWTKFNGIDAGSLKDVSVKGSHIARREFTDLPTHEQLREAFNAASPKVRAQMALVALSGQRLEVLGMRDADDGLRFSAFPEAEFREDGKLGFTRIPALFNVPVELSKTDHGYFGFIGPQAAEYLQAYVAQRVAAGEMVTKDSPVIAPNTAQRRGVSGGNRRFVHTNNIGDSIRNVLRAVGIKTRPYDLRHYFSQNAELGVSDGLNVDWKEFWMGHRPKVKQLYSLRDAKQLIEPMRRDFETKVLKHVETDEQYLAKSTEAKMAAIAEGLGLGENIELLDPDTLARLTRVIYEGRKEIKDLEVVRRERQALDEARASWAKEQQDWIEVQQQWEVQKAAHAAASNGNGGKPNQEIVTEVELEGLLSRGWEIAAVLRSGKIVVKREA